MRWMYAKKPEMAKRWEKETKNEKGLPEKVKGKKSPWMKQKTSKEK